MTTVKVKLRPSSVEGKAGVIYYQITHNRKTQQITCMQRQLFLRLQSAVYATSLP